MKKVLILYGILIIAVVLLAVTRGGGVLTFLGSNNKPTATINKTSYNLLLAKTDAEKIKGLAMRDSIASNTGMLFVFDKPGQYPFWMKNMRFPIDIIFIRDSKIIDIFENAKPITTDPASVVIFKPTSDINYVLEVNAGESTKNKFKKGDKVNFKNVK